MSYPEYLDDMESQLASYLGEDFSTFSSNENPAVSAPLDSPEESSDDVNGLFTWDDFLKAEGIETNSPPPIALEWNPTEANFYMNEIVPPPTFDERVPEEPSQSARQEVEASTNVESGNINEQPVATTFEPELLPEEDTTIPDDDSLFGEDNSDELVSPVSNNGDNSNGEAVAAENQPPNISELEQGGNIDIPDNDSLFGGSTSDDIEVPKINEEHQSEVVAQNANGTPKLAADTPQHGDSAASAPITPGADLNNTNADNDNDSLFGDVDNTDLGEDSQHPENRSPTGDVDDLFGPEIEADFEAELDAGLKRDSANAVAPIFPKHTELHLPKPPQKVTKYQGLHLPDPPRSIANPQGLHLPAPPRKSVAPQGLHLPDPPRAVVNPQGLHLPEAPRVVANSQGLHLPSQPPVTVAQQSGVNTPAQAGAGDQEDEASTRRRRVRASRIPRSDMSRPKGRGQAGKVLTELSGPAPSKLPETAPSSSSGADDTAEKVTRLPRWAFGKYTNFGKPVAGSRYRKPDNSANNPIPVEDEQKSVEKTDEPANTQSQDAAQSNTEKVDAIDLTSDAGDNLVVDSGVQDTQNSSLNNIQDSIRPQEDFQTPAFGNEMALTYGDEPLPNVPDELSFPTVLDNAGPAPQLQTYQSHGSTALGTVAPAAPQYAVPPPPMMEDSSLYGQAPLANNSHQLQVPNVHATGTLAHQSPYTMEQTGVQNYQPIPQPMQTGNYAQGNGHGLPNDMILDNSAATGGSNSSERDNSRPNKRHSHERAEYGDPRVLMSYDEFKQVFPQEQTRGCFETALHNERAADAVIVARGGVPPQRPTIRKSIICTWTQVQHLNRIRAANGEKLFEPKPNAHKRPEAFKESLRRKREERGEISESEESDMEPEAKRLRLAQEPIQMAQPSGEHNGERSSQIHFTQPQNPLASADVLRLPPGYEAPQGPVSQNRPSVSFPQINRLVRNAMPHVEQRSGQTPAMHSTQPSHPQVPAAVSHPSTNHGGIQGPHAQNMVQAPSMHIHQPVAQSAKRKMAPEQWESLESMGQEMRPAAKRPRIAAPSRQNTQLMSNQSADKGLQDYIVERQSEYLKLRVPELRQLCKTREVKSSRINDLTKGGLVGLLVGQDVSRHPVYSQVHSQAQAQAQTGLGVRHGHPVSNVGEMGRMNPPVVAANRAQQQPRAPMGMRQDQPRPNFGPANGVETNDRQQGPLLFRPTPSHNPNGPRVVGNGNTAQSSRNVGRPQQSSMSGNVRGLANNNGQPLANTRQPPVIGQHGHVSMANQDRGNLYARSRLPVSVNNTGNNNSGIHPNVNGGRVNFTRANANVPAYGIAGDFGTGIYQPAVDDRRRKPRIQGQEAPSRAPRGNQRSIPQPAMNVPQPVMNNSARQYTGTQQPMVGSASGNVQMGHPANALGSQIPRPATRGNNGGDPRSFMQNHPQGGLYIAPL